MPKSRYLLVIHPDLLSAAKSAAFERHMSVSCLICSAIGDALIGTSDSLYKKTVVSVVDKNLPTGENTQ